MLNNDLKKKKNNANSNYKKQNFKTISSLIIDITNFILFNA